MKRIIIEGESGAEIEKQLIYCDSLTNAINDMAQAKHQAIKKMWDQVKKEYPAISDNCNLSLIEGKVLLVDRLND